jgi:hypothetical protein
VGHGWRAVRRLALGVQERHDDREPVAMSSPSRTRPAGWEEGAPASKHIGRKDRTRCHDSERGVQLRPVEVRIRPSRQSPARLLPAQSRCRIRIPRGPPNPRPNHTDGEDGLWAVVPDRRPCQLLSRRTTARRSSRPIVVWFGMWQEGRGRAARARPRQLHALVRWHQVRYTSRRCPSFTTMMRRI